MFRRPIQFAGSARFEGAALHERIAPPAQRRNVNVDPVVPPVDRFGGKIKNFFLFGRKHCGEQPCVFAFEDVLVVQNERLVELDQFFGAN